MANECESENYVAEIGKILLAGATMPALRNIIRAATYIQRCCMQHLWTCAIRGDGSDTTRERLQQFVKDRLLPYKYPHIVEFVANLPKTGTGKIDRQALRCVDGGAADGA